MHGLHLILSKIRGSFYLDYLFMVFQYVRHDGRAESFRIRKSFTLSSWYCSLLSARGTDSWPTATSSFPTLPVTGLYSTALTY